MVRIPIGKVKGDNGWTPSLTPLNDGGRQVFYVTWKNGTGIKPEDGYLYEGGITDDISLATAVGGKPVRYTHQQEAESKSWNIQHNLGEKYVEVLIIDASGDQVEGFVDYGNSTVNMLTVSFANAMKGVAFVKY